MNIFGFLTPAWVKPALIALSYVVVAAGASYVSWELRSAQELRDKVAEQNETIVLQKAEVTVTAKVATKTAKAKQEVKIVYVDREAITDDYDEEQARGNQPTPYSPGGDVGAGLVVPGRFVCMWNGANQGERVPDPRCLADATPSGIGLRDIERQHSHEAGVTKDLAVDLRGLQLWVCEQAKLHNGVYPPFEVCGMGAMP